MKTIKTLVLLCILLFTSFAEGQEIPAAGRNNFYVSPFHVLANTFSVGYERVNSNENSFLTNANTFFKKENQEKELGFGIEFQYRISLYRTKTENGKIEGYFSPFLQGYYFKLSQESNYLDMIYPSSHQPSCRKMISAGTGTVFGMRTSLHRFVVDVYFGGGFKCPLGKDQDRYSYSYALFDPDYAGIFPKIGLQFGINF